MNNTKLREKILYFFDNISKKDYKLRYTNPELYEQFQKLTKNYPNQIYYRKIHNIRDINHYILYRLSDKNKVKMFANYCYKNKIPMSSSILKYYKINLNMVEFYEIIHGVFPKCAHCNNNLPTLKVQLYTPLEFNKGRFCSSVCQKSAHIDKVKNVLQCYDSSLVKYTSKFSIITCVECGNHLERNTSNIFSKEMFKCNDCLSKYSKGQYEIYQLLKEYDADIQLEVRNVLPGKILDIYSEKYKIAIEFDGLMYHSYGASKHATYNKLNIDSKSHYTRMDELNKLGVRLFRVWDIEWINEKTRVKWINVLTNAFKKSDNRLYARKCQINEVNTTDAKKFMSDNHMQGFAPAKIYYGLYHSEKLVSIMSFGKSIRSKGDWELLRFCSLNNHNIVGAASKLLKHFERANTPETLISYANLRWSEGKIYELLGFDCDKVVCPSYYYFMNNYDRTLKIYHRTKFTRSNIEKYYKEKTYEIYKFNDEYTEFENMFDNKYRIIYDCGMKKYVKYYKAR